MVFIGKIKTVAKKPNKTEVRLYMDARTDKRMKTIASMTDQTTSQLVENLLNKYLPIEYEELWERHSLGILNGQDD